MTKKKVGLFALGHREWNQINTLYYFIFSCGAAAEREPWLPHA
jgi:hypothetical protein